ncbi:C39 family peptidase [Hyalangium sp.]|uniref:C39 family peptidase n=1 Tax=Hyalangium sp. TaxID=2028555 RepID=UPI002D387599|nr:C39 family peptidase [Hyalangium sp.]HYH96366.1 C39 family peptidase [Hyalangium sp.]
MTTIRKDTSSTSQASKRTESSHSSHGATTQRAGGSAEKAQSSPARALSFDKSSFTAAQRPRVELNPTNFANRVDVRNALRGPEGAGTPGEYVRTKDALNLRGVPSTENNTPVAVIPQGTRLEVTADANGETRKDGFVHVSWSDNGTARSGWVAERFTEPSAPPSPADEQALEQAKDVYINQFAAEQQVSYTDPATGQAVTGDGSNANCGPTSVAMALEAQGLSLPPIPGVTSNGTAGDQVQAARFHMYNGADGARDGVVLQDANDPSKGYQYSPMKGAGNENSTYTGFSGVERAVTAAGGKAEYIPASSSGVAQAIAEGKSVVLSGDFTEQVPVPAQPGQPANAQGQLLDANGNVVTQAATKTDTWARGGGATQHLVAVTGMTAEGNFIVCDPAHPDSRPVEVTPAQLDAFMRGNAGAMSVDGTP